METNSKKGQPKEKNNDYLFRARYNKGVSHCLSKEGRSVGKSFSDKRLVTKEKTSGMPWMEALGVQKLLAGY